MGGRSLITMGKNATASAAVTDGAEVEAPAEVVKVNLGDTNALKNALDEIVGKPYTERGFTENMSQDNIKILLGIACSLFGLFGQFHHWMGFPSFPNDRHILLICVLGYVVFSSAMTVVLFFNGGCIFRLDAPESSNFGEAYSYLKGISKLNVITNLPRFDGIYEIMLEIQTEDGEWHSHESCSDLKSDRSLGEFFTENGTLVETNFTKFVRDSFKKAAKAVTKAPKAKGSKQKSS